jgi:hypothetical protein
MKQSGKKHSSQEFSQTWQLHQMSVRHAFLDAAPDVMSQLYQTLQNLAPLRIVSSCLACF